MAKKKKIDLCYSCDFYRSDLDKSDASKNWSGTGACGVDCNVCKLYVKGECSNCGSGISTDGIKKRDAQIKLFGLACAVLNCAIEKEIAYCMRDCNEFPCNNFKKAQYPYSPSFLQMQNRRRKEIGFQQKAAWPSTSDQFWDFLNERKKEDISKLGIAPMDESDRFHLKSLNETWIIDPVKKNVTKKSNGFGGEWDRHLPFLSVVYLSNVDDTMISGDKTVPGDLYSGVDIFKGLLALDTVEVEKTFGKDPEKFIEAATSLGGNVISEADVAVSIPVFPKFTIDYLLWLADSEFPARLTLLIDRSVTKFLPADAISMCINQLNKRLCLEAR